MSKRKTAAAPAQGGFCLLTFRPEQLSAHGLPECKYPIPIDAVDGVLSETVDLSPEQLLVWMQEYVDHEAAPWLDYEAPMRRLIERITPDDQRQEIVLNGDHWSLVCGPVDMDAALVSFCRQGVVLAAAQKNPDGRLRVSSYHPLDGRACRLLVGSSRNPGPDGLVCMRPNNWEYLGDNACGAGQAYALDRGEVYMSLWEHGFGIDRHGMPDEQWHIGRPATALPSASTAMQLGLYYQLCSDDRW